MQTIVIATVTVIMVLLLAWLGWRLLSKRVRLPCPTYLAWILDNPFMSGYHSKVLSRLELRPGHHVLDAGCGPGIFTTAIAGIVAPNGFVLALDVQPGMIEKTRTRVVKSGLRNIDYLIAPLGAGKLPRSRFDRAILVTVLGEIPDKVAALKEIQASLKPGGFLSITEVLPDPHYQSLGRILNLTEQSGLRFRNRFGNLLMFTVNVEKPV